jgi:hypothetical protein
MDPDALGFEFGDDVDAIQMVRLKLQGSLRGWGTAGVDPMVKL